MKPVFTFLFLLLHLAQLRAQGVAINENGSAPAASAQLDVSSSNKGILMPRMTTVQRKAIASPAAGLMVYETDTQAFYFFDGGQWRRLTFVADNKLTLTGRESVTYGHTGFRVAIFNEWAAATASQDLVNGKKGSVYLYRRTNNNWSQASKINAPDQGLEDNFGYALSMNGNHLVIGASKHSANNIISGAAYIYELVNGIWIQKQKLLPPQAQAESFGSSVSIDGNHLAIGAPFRDKNGTTNCGAVYLYEKVNGLWVLKSTLYSFLSQQDEAFGMSVSIRGNTMAVGIPRRTYNGVKSGIVYVYNLVNGVWTGTGELHTNPAIASMHFGMNVAVAEDDRIVVSAPNYNHPIVQQEIGRVSIFKKSGANWTETLLQHREGNLLFGNTLATAGTNTLAGSIYHEGYLHYFKDGKLEQVLMDPDGDASVFGISCAMDPSGNFIIGASSKNDKKGAVYFGKISN